MPKFVLLWTDAAIWLLTAALLAYVVFAWRRPNLRTSWRKVFMDAPSLASSIVLLLCLAVCLLDSVHYRPLLPPAPGTTAVAYDARTRSLLDAWLADLVDGREATYSTPLATVSFTRESEIVDGRVERVAPRLKYGGAHLKDPATQWLPDVLERGATGLVLGLAAALLASAALVALLAALGAAYLWGALRGRQADLLDDPAESALPGAGSRVALLTLGLAAILALTPLAGIGVACSLAFALVARAFGSRRPLHDLVVGVLFVFVAWFVFDRLLGVQLGRFASFVPWP